MTYRTARGERAWQEQLGRLKMRTLLRDAFSEAAMLDNAPLIVWSKAQMRGVRSVLLRSGKGKP